MISSKVLAHRVVQGCPTEKGKFSFSQLMVAILDLAENKKSVSILETVQDRAVLSKF